MSDTPVIHNIIHLNGESTDVPSRRDPFLGLERERETSEGGAGHSGPKT